MEQQSMTRQVQITETVEVSLSMILKIHTLNRMFETSNTGQISRKLSMIKVKHFVDPISD